MSILIKGVNMPKSCGDCPCQQEEYGYCQVIEEEARFCDYKSRPEWCPLVPVPTSHGKWIVHKILDYLGRPTSRRAAECSKCGYITPEWGPPSGTFYWGYCPNCGARMDGEKE